MTTLPGAASASDPSAGDGENSRRSQLPRLMAGSIRDDRHVIVSLHVATGAAMGALVRSRPLALLLGPPLHVGGDQVPHEDIPSESFELASGLVALGALAARRGPFDPAVLGGAAAALPDLEHLVPWVRPRGEMIFHRGGGRHGGGIPAEAQLLLAGALVGLLLARRR